MVAWRYEISLLVLKKNIYFFSTWKEKFCISARPCNILYVLHVIFNNKFSHLIYSISVTADYYFNVHDQSNEELLQDNLSMIHRSLRESKNYLYYYIIDIIIILLTSNDCLWLLPFEYPPKCILILSSELLEFDSVVFLYTGLSKFIDLRLLQNKCITAFKKSQTD